MMSARTAHAMGPFGYAFMNSNNPPPPVPGPAPQSQRNLLDQAESSGLTHFFNLMERDDTTGGMSLLQDFDLDSSSAMNFDTSHSFPPPHLYGYYSALPQGQFSPPSMIGTDHFPMDSVTPADLELPYTSTTMADLEHSADVIAAAETLAPNRPIQNARSAGSLSNRPNYRQEFLAHRDASIVLNQTPRSFDAPFNSLSSLGTSNSPKNSLDNPQFGSDRQFNGNEYVPQSEHESAEEVTKNLMHNMECLDPNGSVNKRRTSIQPSTPISRSPAARRRMASMETVRTALSESQRRPHKRQKSSLGESVSTLSASPRQSMRTKIKTDAAIKDEDEPLPRKNNKAKNNPESRRKAASSSQRENLTEQQKRENHILSEQKRRDLIKTGFRDLVDLVPQVAEGAFSKSAVLMQTATYVEQLVREEWALTSILKSRFGIVLREDKGPDND